MILGVTLLVVLGTIVGAVLYGRAQSKAKSVEDWALGGRRMGTLIFWFLNAGEIYTTFAVLGISGFAYRFDLTIDRPHFAQTGWDWQAPFAQIFAMAWKPWHLIAILPGGQTLTLPDQSLTIETPKIEASLRKVLGA